MTKPSLRAAIYARFSTDKQRDASIDDQIDSCRELAAREGWQITGTYHDRATSGASMFRPGIEALQRDAKLGRFDLGTGRGDGPPVAQARRYREVS